MMNERKKKIRVEPLQYPPIRSEENFKPLPETSREHPGGFVAGQINDEITEQITQALAGHGAALLLSGLHNIQDVIEIHELISQHMQQRGIKITIITNDLDLDLDLDDPEHTL